MPGEIDVKFLREFRTIIEARIKQQEKFLLITGGGRTSRRYSEAAKILGSMLGEKLYSQVRNGDISHEQFLEWLQFPISDEEFSEFYWRLLKRLK